MDKKTREELYKKKLYDLKGDEYTMEEPYVNMKVKVLFKHTTCNYSWRTSPDNILRTKSGCPKCSGNARMSTTLFIEEVVREVGSEYTTLGVYHNARKPIQMIHNDCGYVFHVAPDSFLRQGTRCPKCMGTLKATHDDIVFKVHQATDGEYEFASTDGMVKKAECLHITCGYSWSIPPYNIITKGIRCPKCAGNAKRTHNDLVSLVDGMYGVGEYTFLEPYINHTTPIKCAHSCGHTWSISPSNILKGRQCPNCRRESNGEKLVRETLQELEIPHESQKTFEGCRYVNPLPFDFYVPSINTAIEYDGEQHFYPVNFGGRSYEESVEDLKLVQLRDSIKTTFCKKNGITLIRLPYTLSKLEVRDTLLNLFSKSRK